MLHVARAVLCALIVSTPVFAQAPRGSGPGSTPPAPTPRLSVTSTAWPDGGEIPAQNAARGDNKSPAFEFHWFLGTTPTSAPAALQSYAVIFHDIENATMRGTADTLHWAAFNIPGSATGLPEGLGAGDLPDGTINGPGIARRNNNPGAYYGPGAGPGPFHHYVFEFYALDTKLSLTNTAGREDLVKAMEGHVIGKAAFTGRYHAPAP
jgi:Raf kinase inhibitor-like YbhB/YbcL family protein